MPIKLILAALYVVLSSSSLVLMKWAFGHSPSTGLRAYLTVPVLIAICGYGLSFILWTVVISKFNLTSIYPVANGLIFVLIYVLSIFLLGDHPSLKGIIGAVVILIGVLLIS